MLFKDISLLEIWRPFCLQERDYLCNVGKAHYGKHFYVKNVCIWTSGQEETMFKDIIYLEL